MTTMEVLVQGYYGRSDLLQRIEARLRTVGVDPQKPGFRDLHPFDQLHGLGILATEEHAVRAGLRPAGPGRQRGQRRMTRAKRSAMLSRFVA